MNIGPGTQKPHWLIELIATWGYVQRNYYLTKRYFMWEVVWLVYTTMNAVTITFIGAGAGELAGGGFDTGRYMTYLLVGALIWSYLSMIFDVLSETVSWERWEGTMEYTFMSPASRATHLLGMGIYAVIYGIIRTAIVLGVASLFFDLDLSERELPRRAGRARRMQHLSRRVWGGRRRDAAPLPGEGAAGYVHRLGGASARLGRLLRRFRSAGLDADRRHVLARNLRPRRHPGLASRRRKARSTLGEHLASLADGRRLRADGSLGLQPRRGLR